MIKALGFIGLVGELLDQTKNEHRKAMASTAHTSAEYMTEHYNSKEALSAKVDRLAALIMGSKATIAFTGRLYERRKSLTSEAPTACGRARPKGVALPVVSRHSVLGRPRRTCRLSSCNGVASSSIS